jgi:hypothetical protein
MLSETSTSALLQPTHDRVLPNLLARFGLVFKGALPVYAALHTLPAVFLKRGSLVRRRKVVVEDAPLPEVDDSGLLAVQLATTPSSMTALELKLTPTANAEQAKAVSSGRRTSAWASWWRKIHWAEVLKILRRSIVGTARSGTFLALFVVIYHGVLSFFICPPPPFKLVD